jgi:microcystin-dependent protein
MSHSELTRRAVLQAGAGLVLGAVGLRAEAADQVASAATRAKITDTVHAGELRLFAGDYVPSGWLGCTGEELTRKDYPELAHAVGDAFGAAKPEHFRVPDLRGRAVVGQGTPPDAPAFHVGEYRRALAVHDPDNLPSTLGLTYLIAPRSAPQEALIGEVRAFAFGFAPRDWQVCDGREIQISLHLHLFAVIGTRFGGDGRDILALPDLRSRTPLGHGDGPGVPPVPMGSRRENLAPNGEGRRPRLHVNYCIAYRGAFPTRKG